MKEALADIKNTQREINRFYGFQEGAKADIEPSVAGKNQHLKRLGFQVEPFLQWS